MIDTKTSHHKHENQAPGNASSAAKVRIGESSCASGSGARAGLIFALSAYLWWGFVPIYFKAVAHVPPLIVLSHRIVWSVVFLAMIIAFQRRWREVFEVLKDWRTLGLLALGAGLIALNWFVFIYAVSSDQILQASLGYYINPLVTVLLGWTVLRERLTRWQWVSVGLAVVGVGVSAAGGSAVPWIALILACSFAVYGLLRKVVRVGPMIGLLVETVVLLPAAFVLIGWGLGTHGGMTSGTYGLLMLAGIVTATPLLWFVAAAKRLALSTVGFLQYLAPSVQFVIAITIFDEPLDLRRLVAFVFIWSALGVFTVDSWYRLRRDRRARRIADPIEAEPFPE